MNDQGSDQVLIKPHKILNVKFAYWCTTQVKLSKTFFFLGGVFFSLDSQIFVTIFELSMKNTLK